MAFSLLRTFAPGSEKARYCKMWPTQQNSLNDIISVDYCSIVRKLVKFYLLNSWSVCGSSTLLLNLCPSNHIATPLPLPPLRNCRSCTTAVTASKPFPYFSHCYQQVRAPTLSPGNVNAASCRPYGVFSHGRNTMHGAFSAYSDQGLRRFVYFYKVLYSPAHCLHLYNLLSKATHFGSVPGTVTFSCQSATSVLDATLLLYAVFLPLGQLSFASLRGRLIEYQLRLG